MSLRFANITNIRLRYTESALSSLKLIMGRNAAKITGIDLVMEFHNKALFACIQQRRRNAATRTGIRPAMRRSCYVAPFGLSKCGFGWVGQSEFRWRDRAGIHIRVGHLRLVDMRRKSLHGQNHCILSWHGWVGLTVLVDLAYSLFSPRMAPLRGPVGLVLLAVEFKMESYTCIDSYSLGGGA